MLVFYIGAYVIVDYNPWDTRIEFDLRSSRVISKYMIVGSARNDQ